MKKLLFIINPMAGRQQAQTDLYKMVRSSPTTITRSPSTPPAPGWIAPGRCWRTPVGSIWSSAAAAMAP